MTEDNLTIKERLEMYLKFKKITKMAFGKTIGVSSAYITSMRNSLQPDKIKSIALNYPDLNIAWLLVGSGEMLADRATVGETVTMPREVFDKISTMLDTINNQQDTIHSQQRTIEYLAVEKRQEPVQTVVAVKCADAQ